MPAERVSRVALATVALGMLHHAGEVARRKHGITIVEDLRAPPIAKPSQDGPIEEPIIF
jgi:hypothetical protein